MKTVIELAREAGFVLIKSEWAYVDMLERFAELVRADECDACAKFVENYDVDIAEAIRARGLK